MRAGPGRGAQTSVGRLRPLPILALAMALAISGLAGVMVGPTVRAPSRSLELPPTPDSSRAGSPRPAGPGASAGSDGEYRVTETLVLPNDSLRAGEFAASNGLGPGALVYDSGRRAVFVANTNSNSITAVNGTTGAIVGSLAVGPGPASLAYDPSLGTIYIANGSFGSVATSQSSIWEFNDTTYQGSAIPTGTEPNAVAYDPQNEEVFVANSGANTVSVINATNSSLVATVAVPSAAWGIAYDAWLNEVVVVLMATGSVTLIDAGNLTIRATVPVGLNPYVATGAGPGGAIVVGNEGSDNVTVLNGTTGRTVASIPVGSYPDAVQYDPLNGEVFVANANSNNLSVVNISRDTVVGSIPVGSGPDALALNPTHQTLYVAEGNGNALTFVNATTWATGKSYLLGLQPVAATFDPVQNQLYIGDSDSDLVSVVNLTGPNLVQNIPLPDNPAAGAFDPALDQIAVAESNGTDLALLDGANLSQVGQIAVGADPDAVAYAAGLGEWIVANGGAGTVSILNATDDAPVANLTVGIYPDSIALVPGQDLAVVANGYSDNLSVLNLSVNRVVATLAGGLDPVDAVYDPMTAQVLVADALSGQIEAWNLTGGNFSAASVGATPISLAVDPATGAWIAADQASSSLAIVPPGNRSVQDRVPVGSDPTQVLVDPLTGTIYVVDLGSASLSVVEPQLYPVNASEFGLPLGTGWSLRLAGGPTVDSTARTLAWNLTNGTYRYQVVSLYPDRIDPAPGSFVVDGAPLELQFLFRQPYTISVAEIGTPNGSAWWFNLSDGQSFVSRGPSLEFPQVNGTFAYLATTSVPDRAPVSGELNVSGAPQSLRVRFRSQFPVTVLAVGLPPGAAWTFNLSGGGARTTDGLSMSFPLVNGSYAYRAGAPDSGRMSVSGRFNVSGAPLALTIRFVPFLSPVTLTVSGLPAGMGWSIQFENGTTLTFSTNPVALDQPNGSYTFSASAADPNYGAPRVTYRVDGSPVQLNVAFRLPHYAVRFVPVGIPAGTPWWLALPAGTWSSPSGGPIVLNLANGSYAVRAGSRTGSFEAPLHPSVVAGENRTVMLSFSPVLFEVTWVAIGLPNGTPWSVAVDGVQAVSSNLSIDAALMNGSYPFSIRAPAGYRVENLTGVVLVQGRSVVVRVEFRANAPPPGPGTLGWLVPMLAVLGVGGAAVVAISLIRSRPRRVRMNWEPPRRRR